MTHSHREFNDDHTPLAYLITFRCYGTWLHGDSRGSVDRFHNRYGSPLIAPNRRWLQHNERAQKRPPVNLNRRRRAAVKEAIKEVCRIRRWQLWTCNIRTNHVHTVVTANSPFRGSGGHASRPARHCLQRFFQCETPHVKSFADNHAVNAAFAHRAEPLDVLK